MRFKIVFHHPHKCVERFCKRQSEINDVIYVTLTNHGISAETAIDCASWCEIAVVGGTYNTEEFDLYVEVAE